MTGPERNGPPARGPLARALGVLLLSAFLAAPAAPGRAADPDGEEEAARTGRVTGFALPRFVSLKATRANMRRGPGLDLIPVCYSSQVGWYL